jgi:uncharacterized membrane protein
MRKNKTSSLEPDSRGLSMGNNLADKIVEIIGSWKFLGIQSALLIVYVLVNLFIFPFDPYPFVFLNLMLSFQAAYTAPIILMSHSRMAERDRALAKKDREDLHTILSAMKRLEKNFEKELDDAVKEITEAIEEDDKQE